jgi:hypothetical protein
MTYRSKNFMLPHISVCFLLSITTACYTSMAIGRDDIRSTSNESGNYNVTDKREYEVIRMLHQNLSWTFGKGLTPYRWPTSQDAKKVYSLLNDSDVPVLIKIISKKNVDEAELVSAKWVLSMYTDKAQPTVMKLYESSTTPLEQSVWKEVLDLIEVRKIEQRKP